jgi:putative RNA 2'-phosphotransferase
MDTRRLTHVSKHLSYHLRHAPHELGLELGPGGWVSVDALLEASAARGFAIGRDELAEVVSTSDKQRFSFDASGAQIRANQGHSVPVDLELAPSVPPGVLYHGTAHRTVSAIRETGLMKMGRHHVHLSSDAETACRVGARHGNPAIFAVAASAMHQQGHLFYVSENGVWLVDRVPPEFLDLLP